MVRHLRLVDTITEPEGEEALKVAFASDDLHHVNQHFGSAAAFVVYTVDGDGYHLLEVAQFTGPSARDGNEGKLAPRLLSVEGCDAVYAEAIGPSAKSQLAARNVQGLCVPIGTPINEILDSLLASLRGEAQFGVVAALRRRRDPDRFAGMESEGWTE